MTVLSIYQLFIHFISYLSILQSFLNHLAIFSLQYLHILMLVLLLLSEKDDLIQPFSKCIRIIPPCSQCPFGGIKKIIRDMLSKLCLTRLIDKTFYLSLVNGYYWTKRY